jgi:GxxExxY protein
MPYTSLRKSDIFYPELSYQIVGILFSVYNELGPGHHERYYQRAVAQLLKESGLNFQEQRSIPTKFRGTYIGRSQLDFIIENKIVLEIKKGSRFSKRHIDQVLQYLKDTKLRLAILATFKQEGVVFKRIVNFEA